MEIRGEGKDLREGEDLRESGGGGGLIVLTEWDELLSHRSSRCKRRSPGATALTSAR